MKNTLLTIGLAGISTALLSFTFIQKSNEVQEPKKERHVKMTKIENGKKVELDTVLTHDDVFVWNGDTINPGRHIKDPRPSGIDKMQHVTIDHKGGKEKVMIIKHSGKGGEPMIWNMDSGENMEIVTEDVDSLGKRIIVRKRINHGDSDSMYFFHDGDMTHFPPMPTVPPVPHMKMMRLQHSGQIIDLNDPNVISYKKKDLSGDREKIEIIRKKSVEPEESTFNFEFDDEMMPPPPPNSPDAPEIIREYNDGNGNIKNIEKSTKVEGKEGKQVEVEVESKEEK